MSKFYVFLLGFILLNATHMHAGDRQDRNLRRGNLYQNNKIASGEYHTLEIRNGTLWAWGINNKGQLGDGTTNYRQYPVLIGSDNDWVSVSAIYDHSLGLKADGTLWAWGLNDRGQLGDGTNTNRTSPVQVGSANDWIHVCAGYENSIAMKSDGTLWSWGAGGSILGNGNLFDIYTPTLVNTDKNWVDVSLFFHHVLATKSDGSLWAWGDNSYGKIGDGTTTRRNTPVQVGAADDWVNVAAGGEFSIAMKSDGTLWAWGRNTYGQLGDGTTSLRLVPQQIGTDNDWVSIKTDVYHTIAIKSDGTMWSWGKNDVGQLGDGTTTNRTSPVQIGNLTGWVCAAVGEDCSYALNKNGTLWAWGYNSFSKLGNGSIATYITSPVQVRTAPDEILMVSAGNNHSLALKTDGTLYAWGLNSGGELGNGTYTGTRYPVKVHHPNRWTKAYAGEGFSLGLSTDGTIWSWGTNGNRQLGDGTNVKKNTPVKIGTDSNWIDISGGGYHALALKADGTLWGWGSNFYGMIGDGTTTTRSSPVQIGSDTDWVYISAGRTHSFAIKNNGTLWAWGENSSVGRLGDGTTTTRLSPVQIGTDTTWVQVSASHNAHSAGLKSNGTVWGWGYNADGQVGDGSTSNRLSPVQAGNDTNWTSITTGGDHTMARKSDGTLWAWGRNPYGELGDGTMISRSSPVQMETDNDWVNADGGTFFTLAVHADRKHICGIGRGGMIGDSTFLDRSSFSCFTIEDPEITRQPEDTAICNGTNAGFIVTATGAHYYEWQVNSGNGWVNLSDTGIYTGSTNDTLLLTGVTGVVDSNWYRVVINSTDTSDSVQIFIKTPHNIITQPTPKTICDRDSVVFSVNTIGSVDSFGWFATNGVHTEGIVDGGSSIAIVTGASTNSVTIANTANTLDSFRFFVIVSGGCSPADTSDSVMLRINAVPNITSQPTNKTICEGSTTTYTMAATGTGLTYQWYYTDSLGLVMLYMMDGTYSWGTVSGATTGTMTLSNVSSTINGLYFKGEVSGTCASPDTSNLVSLTVNTSPNITADPTSKTICAGSSTTYSVTATGVGLTYQWQASINGGISYNNLSNSGIYSGVTTNTLSLTNPTTSYDGTIYRAIVSGSCMPADTSDTASLTINTAPSIISYPTNKTICDGGSTNFSLFATGTNVTYQWQVSTNGGGTWNNVSNGGIYSGATNTVLYITGAPASMNNYKYRAIASGTCAPSETSIEVTLTFNTLPNITTHPTNKTICEGNNTSYSVTATGTGLTYQWQVHDGTSWSDVTNTGIYSGATTSTLSLTAATAIYNGYQYRAIVNGTCTPSDTSDIVLLTVNTAPNISSHPANSIICNGANTSFTVAATGAGLSYQWQVHNGTSWSNLSNTGIYSGATTATLSLANAPATVHNYQYRCVVSGTCAPAQSSAAATLFIITTPVVNTQPVNKTVCLGDNTTYSAAATGTMPVTYQWQGSMNGTTWSNLLNVGIYSGTTTSTLSLTGVYGGAYSMYRCVVSSGCTAAMTNTATLTVNTEPVIAIQPASDTKCSGQNTTFAISATGTGLSYQWQVSTNGGSTWNNLANGGIYTGATSNSLNLAGVTPAYNSYRYRCIVTGVCAPAKTSSAAILTVNTPVAISSFPPATQTLCSGDNTSLSVTASGTGISYKWYIKTGATWSLINNGGIYSGATTGTLNITGIPAPVNTQLYVYYCQVTGSCNSAATNYTYVTVHARPNITANPANVTKCDSTNNATFTVAATGTNLSYQWQLNTGSGWNNLANNSTYTGVTTPVLLLPNLYYSMNGYQYRCVVTGTCTPAATSAVATLNVNPLITPSVTIAATSEDICNGTSVTFTPSPINGGSANYVWKRNGNTVGSGATYTSSALANGDIIWCDMTSNIACPSPKSVRSNQVTMKVTPYSTPTIVVTSDVGTSWCSGKPAVFRANITNGGTIPTYEWQINGLTVGSNIDTYLTAQLLNGDMVRCKLTSSLQCPSPAIVTSNTLNMTINQTTRSSIVIVPNPDSVICDNTEVTMYSFYTNSGTTPSFQWMLNGQDIPGETGATMRTTALNDGDTLACRFTSSATCVFPETSNSIVFSVGKPVDPSVNITVIYIGNNTYRFTAIPVNGGQNPAYQWYKNTVPIPGATGATYEASNLAKTDRIHVELTSSEPCVRVNLETVESRSLTTGVSDFGNNFAELGLYPNPNNGQFVIKGRFAEQPEGNKALVKITNSLGQLVYSNEYPLYSRDINLPVFMEQNLANGMYQVNIAVDNNVSTIRFVINR